MNLVTVIPIQDDNEETAFFVGLQVDLVEQPNAILERMKGERWISDLYCVMHAFLTWQICVCVTRRNVHCQLSADEYPSVYSRQQWVNDQHKDWFCRITELIFNQCQKMSLWNLWMITLEKCQRCLHQARLHDRKSCSSSVAPVRTSNRFNKNGTGYCWTNHATLSTSCLWKVSFCIAPDHVRGCWSTIPKNLLATRSAPSVIRPILSL